MQRALATQHRLWSLLVGFSQFSLRLYGFVTKFSSLDKVVWRHDENIPIILGLQLEYINREECIMELCDSPLISMCKVPIRIFYEIYITGKGGRFQILKESLAAQGNGLDVSIDTDKGELIAAVSKEALEEIFKGDTSMPTLKSDSLRLSVKLKIIQEVRPLITLATHSMLLSIFRKNLDDLVEIVRRQITDEKITKRYISYFLKIIIDNVAFHLSKAINTVQNFINSITVVKDIDWKAIRSPQTLTKQGKLSPDASNFAPFLYTGAEGSVSESLVEALKYAFVGANDLRLGFSVTEDGRVFLRLVVDGTTLTPASIPSGVLKTLIIESLLSRAGVIVIDEVENSLHPELQQFLLDEFRSRGAFVILTTHSTVPLDYAKSVNEVVVLKLEGGETKAYRLGKEAEEALKKHKMTLSELFDSGLLEPIR
jgi:hypothetical protein